MPTVSVSGELRIGADEVQMPVLQPHDAATIASVAPLFRPTTIGTLSLANRVVMAPMSRFAAPKGLPTAEMASYYSKRARHGCGLIITEAASIASAAAAPYRRSPAFYGAALEGWGRIAEDVHAAGGRIWAQIWHAGAHRVPAQSPSPDAPNQSPSGLDPAFAVSGQPMTQAEIEQTIANFARAAYEAEALGFDGVQVHGAHGYLVDEFFWDRTNQRQDNYGGSNKARSRFAAEIIAAIRAEVGNDFPVSLRISQWKLDHYGVKMCPNPAALSAMLQPLVAAGVDVFDCSQRRFWESEFDDSTLNFAGWVKRLSGRPTITVGSVGLSGPMDARQLRGDDLSCSQDNIGDLMERLAQDEFDLVAIGRSMIANPDWAEKVRSGNAGALASFDTSLLERLE